MWDAGATMCSGSEEGSYSRLIGFFITRVIKKKKKKNAGAGATSFSNPERPAECQNSGDAEVRVSTLDVHAFRI